jgi:putative GTP pyrophosphokinase
MEKDIIKQYEEKKHSYKCMAEKMETLIMDICKAKSISVHEINSRVKEKDSLLKKINKKSDKYNDISEITDICGLRIITFFESNVDIVADLIESEFKIDKNNSIDKRKLKVDQFGYKSLHYVVEFSDKRIKLVEYHPFKGMKAEIQIRSILQHAWAEIEHDLGYKSERSIPEKHRRDFNRVSALLETADIEFDRLRVSLSDYEKEVEREIKNNPENVKIDQASIIAFISSNKILKDAEKIIRTEMKCEFKSSKYIEIILEKLEFFEIKTIGELERCLNENKDMYLNYLEYFVEGKRYEILPNIVSLYFFLHYLASKTESKSYVQEYLTFGEWPISGDPEKNFIEIYRASKLNKKREK